MRSIWKQECLPGKIRVESLERSAKASTRRKRPPNQRCLCSTFTFNRAGKKPPSTRRLALEQAKEELRKLLKPEA